MMLGIDYAEQRIKNKTGYYPGKLYFYCGSDKIVSVERSDSKLYDTATGNFHLVPDFSKREELRAVLAAAAGNVRSVLSERLCEMISERGRASEEKIILNSRFGATASKGLETEKYIAVSSKGFKYMLCFERLYTHADRVHCMFGLFQFYKHPESDKYINKSEGEFFVCYPRGYLDGAAREENGHLVYNPKDLPSVFELDKQGIEKVCEAFIAFISAA